MPKEHDYTLPPGIVCDYCNNYVARKIEKPFLDSLYMVERRHLAGIPNKRGRIPMIEGMVLPSGIRVAMGRDRTDGSRSVGATNDKAVEQWNELLTGPGGKGSFVFPIGTPPEPRTTSRFVAKVGLEALADRAKDVPGGLNEIVDSQELDELREHIRIGGNRTLWPFTRREIYTPERLFHDGDTEYTTSHEYDILVTDKSEYFIVLAIFGEEFVLNLGGRCIEGYEDWLVAHNHASPLYTGKNS